MSEHFRFYLSKDEEERVEILRSCETNCKNLIQFLAEACNLLMGIVQLKDQGRTFGTYYKNGLGKKVFDEFDYVTISDDEKVLEPRSDRFVPFGETAIRRMEKCRSKLKMDSADDFIRHACHVFSRLLVLHAAGQGFCFVERLQGKDRVIAFTIRCVVDHKKEEERKRVYGN